VAAIDFYLVGGRATPLKNMKVSWDYYSQYMKKYPNVPSHQPVGATLLNFNFTSRLYIGYGRWPGVPALFDAYNKLSLPGVRLCKLEVQVRIVTVNGKQKTYNHYYPLFINHGSPSFTIIHHASPWLTSRKPPTAPLLPGSLCQLVRRP